MRSHRCSTPWAARPGRVILCHCGRAWRYSPDKDEETGLMLGYWWKPLRIVKMGA